MAPLSIVESRELSLSSKTDYSTCLGIDLIPDGPAIHELGARYDISSTKLFNPQSNFKTPPKYLSDILFEFSKCYEQAITAKDALQDAIEECLGKSPTQPPPTGEEIQEAIAAIHNQIPKISKSEGSNGTVTKLTEKYAKIFSDPSVSQGHDETFYSALVHFEEFCTYFTDPNVLEAQKQLARWYFLAIDALLLTQGFDLDFYLEKALKALESVEDEENLYNRFEESHLKYPELVEPMRILHEPKPEDFSDLPMDQPNAFAQIFTKFRSTLKKALEEPEQ